MPGFARIEPSLLGGALKIVRTLREHRFEALFAGGAVRDMLLDRPTSDIDVATSARPEDLESLFEHTVPVGKQFGVMIVVVDGHNYEVATFRKDAAYHDGRHPARVEFTDAEEDARRRDFTVNGLFYDPVRDEVIDYVGGREDLKLEILRTVGEPAERFSEDKLRILRAVRFSCQLGFEIESRTYEEVRRRSGEISCVSAERIRDELLKILTGPGPAKGMRMLLETGLFKAFLPEVAAMSGVEQPPEFHPEGDVFVHTCLMFELADEIDEELALGILLHDVGKPPTFRIAERIRFDRHAEVGAEMAEEICRRLRISNDQIHVVVDLVKQHLRFINVMQMRESTLKRFLRQENFEKHLALHRLDCLSSHRDLSNYQFCVEKIAEFGQEVIRPDPLIGGNDLIALGFKPGPLFSEILTAVEDEQLEGRLADRESALTWVRERWPIG